MTEKLQAESSLMTRQKHLVKTHAVTNDSSLKTPQAVFPITGVKREPGQVGSLAIFADHDVAVLAFFVVSIEIQVRISTTPVVSCGGI